MSATIEPIAAPPSSPPAPASASPWIYRPWLDLLVGCGGWSAPLLAVALLMTSAHTHAWAMAFYLLAIVFNYPHFMATIYRAYHTREDFEKYRFVTLHVTLLLVLTGIVMHLSPRFFPWLFTLYICWSPWHYSGQNYGLLMMFARRSGAEITAAERRWLRGAFVASYLMLLASFETGGSSDPLILSLGMPSKFTLPVRLAFGAAFMAFTFLGFRRLIRAMGVRVLVAPLTLAFTQFLWFVLPTLLELNSVSQVPQTRYSSGILAVLHSAQYIWITSYYQRREARAGGQKKWHVAAYFATLLAGGIALFIPGPWLVSYLFHYDFTTSFLIFVSLVNIHHFILDAKLWKLRDKRVAALLVDPSGKPSAAIIDASTRTPSAVRAVAIRILSAPAFRISLATLLFLWGGFDQFHFALRTSEGNLPALLRAAQINPYDSLVEERIARAETQQGEHDEAVAALTRAVALNPSSIALQQAAARALIADGRFAEAYAHYQKMLERFPRDADALTNYGLLAARLGHPEEAIGFLAKIGGRKSQPAERTSLSRGGFRSAKRTGGRRSPLEIVSAIRRSRFAVRAECSHFQPAANPRRHHSIGGRPITHPAVCRGTRRSTIRPSRRRNNPATQAGKPGAGSSRGLAGEEWRCRRGRAVVSTQPGAGRQERRRTSGSAGLVQLRTISARAECAG